MLALEHWHIESSSKCTLRCPRCPRLEVPDSLLHKQLDLNFFQQRLGQPWLNTVQRITFCGNDGDPIYTRDFVDTVEWIKRHRPDCSIVIITNGSYRDSSWWQQLARALNDHDELHFSLDGWDQKSNERYRVNCDWASIVQGISAFRQANTATTLVWAAIAFRFNEQHLEAMLNMARSFHFDVFQLTKSTKFGSHYPEAYGAEDLLEPINPELVSSGHRFERTTTNLSDRARPGADLRDLYLSRIQEIDKHNSYPALCSVGTKGVFLNSRGEFYPCCWTANRYEHNQSWIDMAQSKLNLYERSYTDIVNDPLWDTSFTTGLECQTKCTRASLLDLEHSLEW